MFILSDDDLLFIVYGGTVTSLNRTKNTVIDSTETRYDMNQGLSISKSYNKIIGRSRGISPSDINFLDYDSKGKLGRVQDSPHHGDYEGGTKTWAFPDDSLVRSRIMITVSPCLSI